ncbi:MAG: PepSY-associated TM helix domain-containing protein [Actinobacteria bacterium]|nr:PepSY-associated TM helix domain-containing protein [Actinomycetota bacterium]MCB9388857.1 PepSY-associated TM helix domain-containing protein [Acidimicrobiia bacterium]
MSTEQTQARPDRAEQIKKARAQARARQHGQHTDQSRITKTQVHKWLRMIHVYVGMFCMVAIFFFAATGLLLNNPNWSLGASESVKTSEGTVPDGVIAADGTPDYLAADQFFRSDVGVRGDVTDHGENAGKASITYKSPGYQAYAYFDTSTGDYTVTATSQGMVSTLEDLHTANNTGSQWKLVIDLVAIGLMVIALTGLGIQFFLRKRRRSALTTAGVAAVFLIVFMYWVIWK